MVISGMYGFYLISQLTPGIVCGEPEFKQQARQGVRERRKENRRKNMEEGDIQDEGDNEDEGVLQKREDDIRIYYSEFALEGW
jgi:hypothetical protein